MITDNYSLIINGVRMGLSLGHLLIILIIVLVLFGAGKLPQMMSDMGKGMKAFKNGVKDEEPTVQKLKSITKVSAKAPVKAKAKKKAAPAKAKVVLKSETKVAPKTKVVIKAKPKAAAKSKIVAKKTEKAVVPRKSVSKKAPASKKA